MNHADFAGQTDNIHNPIHPNQPSSMVVHSMDAMAAVSDILWMALPPLPTRAEVAMVEVLFDRFVSTAYVEPT